MNTTPSNTTPSNTTPSNTTQSSTIPPNTIPLNTLAKIAGILTLLIVFLAPFSMVYLPSTLVVAGDAATTAKNIIASEGLFRFGLVSDAAVFLIEIALTVVLYMLLKPVNQTLSLIGAFARLAMTIVQGINLLSHFFVLLLLSGANSLTAFTTAQVQALVMLFLNAHQDGVLIWGLFFALHLLMLGYLVYRSGYLPKFVGIVLLIVSSFYFIQSFGNMLLPQYKSLFTSIGLLSIAEIVFPLWLLIKGVDKSQDHSAFAKP
jgi:hypothetical protein